MLKLKTFDLHKEFVFVPESEEEEENPTTIRATPLSIGERNDLTRVMLVGGADSTKILRRLFRQHVKEILNVTDEDGEIVNIDDPKKIWVVLSDPQNADFYGGVISGLIDGSGLTDTEKKS